jgi:hypothetical protein
LSTVANEREGKIQYSQGNFKALEELKKNPFLE